jgi:hypothetical protein
MIFDNPTFSYNLGGLGSVTFDALAGKTTRINVVSGNHTIGVTTNWQKNMRISTAAGSSIALLNPFIPAAGVSLTKDGPGTAQFVNVRIDAVDVQAGTLRVAAGATANNSGRTSVVKNLAIAPGATLDLTNNSAIIDYTGPVGTLVDDVRLHLQSGRLTSSSATALTGLGYADNAVLNPVKTSFAGQTVDPSSLLIKFTYFGDTDLDGKVDVADLGTLATNWQTQQPWSGGDFDYNGTVNVNDLGLLATNWQAGVGNPLGPSFTEAASALGLPSVAVPEPATIAILGALPLGLKRRRY